MNVREQFENCVLAGVKPPIFLGAGEHVRPALSAHLVGNLGFCHQSLGIICSVHSENLYPRQKGFECILPLTKTSLGES